MKSFFKANSFGKKVALSKGPLKETVWWLNSINTCNNTGRACSVKLCHDCYVPGALQTFNLTWCCALTDATMLAIAKYCTSRLAELLKFDVWIGGCETESERATKTVGRTWPHEFQRVMSWWQPGLVMPRRLYSFVDTVRYHSVKGLSHPNLAYL